VLDLVVEVLKVFILNLRRFTIKVSRLVARVQVSVK